MCRCWDRRRHHHYHYHHHQHHHHPLRWLHTRIIGFAPHRRWVPTSKSYLFVRRRMRVCKVVTGQRKLIGPRPQLRSLSALGSDGLNITWHSSRESPDSSAGRAYQVCGIIKSCGITQYWSKVESYISQVVCTSDLMSVQLVLVSCLKFYDGLSWSLTWWDIICNGLWWSFSVWLSW